MITPPDIFYTVFFYVPSQALHRRAATAQVAEETLSGIGTEIFLPLFGIKGYL
jgi:hypothetical protein